MNMTKEMQPLEGEPAILAFMERHGIVVQSEFVPFSQSRSKAETTPSLNWRVTVKCNGREIVSTDYNAGSGYCPSYKQQWGHVGAYEAQKQRELIAAECETGVAHLYRENLGGVYVRGSKEKHGIKPDACDVLASLAMDSGVIDSGSFEEWANDAGYDADSRKAESIYRACLEIALKLRNGLGESVLAELRDACAGY